nr:CesT family type III secretion system chaperone [uncultured Noviherbaspirillum sp.]
MVTVMLHESLRQYLAALKAGEPAQNADGSFSLIFDSQYRVTFLTLAHGDLLLEARVFQLPDEPRSRRTTLEMLLAQAGSRLEGHPEWIALATGGRMLVLQQVLPAKTDRTQFSASLDDFVNALAGWRRLVGVL